MNAPVTLPQGRASSPTRGFSLVELIAVIVLIGIMAAAAIPSMASAAQSRRRAAASQVTRDINFARDSAVSNGVATWVVFSTASNTYSLFAENRTTPGKAGRTPMTDPATGRAFVQTLNTGDMLGVTLTGASVSGGTEVGFDWKGRAKSASETPLTSDGTISLSDGLTIIIDSQTGRALGP